MAVLGPGLKSEQGGEFRAGVGLCIGGGRKSEFVWGRIAKRGMLLCDDQRELSEPTSAAEASRRDLCAKSSKPAIRERPRSPRWGQERAFKATAGLELS